MTVLLICTQLLQILKTQWTNIVSNSVRPFDIILQVPGPRSLRLTKGYSTYINSIHNSILVHIIISNRGSHVNKTISIK